MMAITGSAARFWSKLRASQAMCYLVTVLAMGAVIAVVLLLSPVLIVPNAGVLYMLVIIASAYWLGTGPAILGLLMSLGAITYVYEPRDENLATFGVRLVVISAASVVGLLIARWARRQERRALALAQETERQAAQLNAVLDSMGEGVLIADLKGDIIQANRAAMKLHGFGEREGSPESEGFLANRLMAPDTVELRRLNGDPLPVGEWPLSRVSRGETIADFEAALRRLNTDWERVFSYNGRPVLDAGGRQTLAIITLRDITERRRADEERERLLRQVESERARFEAVLQQMPSGVAIIEAPSGATILTNEQLVNMWRQESAFASASEFGQLVGVSPDGRAYGRDDWPVVRSIRSGEIVTNEEIRFRRWDGTWGTQIISSAPVRDRAGNTVAAVAVVTEITERKAAEEARERALAELEATVEAAAAGIVAYDRSGRIARMNAAAARIMGYTESDMALPMAELFARLRFETSDGRALPFEQFPPARALRGERVGSVSMALYKINDGSDQKVWIYDGAGPIRLPGGEIVGAVVSFVDLSDQKRLEEELRESEERFRAMVDAIPQLAWMAHADGFIFWYNRRWYEYTGTTPEQMAGWGWQSVHAPGMLPKVLERWKKSIATGEPFDMEYPLRGADGRFRWFLTRISPLKDERGRVVRWFGTNTDVDEKREAEAERARLLQEVAARASELAFERDRLRTVLSSIADAVFVCDATGLITESNAAALALLGVPSVAVGRNLADYLGALRLQYPDGRSVPLEELAITRALSGVTERGREEVGVHPTTRQRIDLFISAAPLRDADGRVVGAVQVTTDITRVRELADVAQRRAAELQAVLDNMVDAVFVCTPDGRITLSNPAASRMFGLPGFDQIRSLPAEFPTLFRLRHPDGRPIESSEMATARALKGETVVDSQQVFHSSQLDQDRYVRVSASPIRDAEGKVAGAVVVARDVTALTELDRLKDEFLVVAAHELKTPVTIMKGYAQALERASFNLPPPARRMIDAIDHGANRIDRIVKDLLDITRLQAGQLELADERVDLAGLAAEVVDRFALTTSKHRMRVVQADPAVVRGDRSRIGEVLADLLDNAVRYSPAGGDVDVAVRVSDGRAVVSVRDQGVGIPREKQSRIFERFYRAHTRTQYDYGGMGVGLYIAREVIARHGGETWFESEEGKGSIFYFSLPLTGE